MAQKRVRSAQYGEVPFGFKVSHSLQVRGGNCEIPQELPCLSKCDREQRLLLRIAARPSHRAVMMTRSEPAES